MALLWCAFHQLLVGTASTTELKWAGSICQISFFVPYSWESLACVFRVKKHRLARARRGLATRRERVRETAEERAKSWVKSARQQKAQTLKILPLIHNDTAVLDIFKFTPHFLFLSVFDNISGFTNCDYLCIKAIPMIFLHHCFFSQVQRVLDNDMNQGVT